MVFDEYWDLRCFCFYLLLDWGKIINQFNIMFKNRCLFKFSTFDHLHKIPYRLKVIIKFLVVYTASKKFHYVYLENL